MRTEALNVEYPGEALLDRLRDRVFHVTSRRAYEGIIRAGAVLHNRDERFPLNVASSKSFGRANGWVCLFDLRGKSEAVIREALSKYYFLAPTWLAEATPNGSTYELAFLFLDAQAWSKLEPNESARSASPSVQYVPEVEVWFKGDLPLDLVDDVLLVSMIDSRSDDELFPWLRPLLEDGAQP